MSCSYNDEEKLSVYEDYVGYFKVRTLKTVLTQDLKVLIPIQYLILPYHNWESNPRMLFFYKKELRTSTSSHFLTYYFLGVLRIRSCPIHVYY